VVVAVAVFLLGVSVGRGVRDRTGAPALAADAAAAGAPDLPAGAMPPPTEIPLDTFKYPGLSKGDGTVGGSSPSAKADAAQPTATTDVPDVPEPEAPPASLEARATAPPVATPKPEPAAKPAPKAELPAPPKEGSGWSLQVGAFRSRENADKQAAVLKGKGYPTTVSAPARGLFRVRVGPYSDRAETERVAARLKQQEGLTPSVSR
jgi:cell division septation protein DedD